MVEVSKWFESEHTDSSAARSMNVSFRDYIRINNILFWCIRNNSYFDNTEVTFFVDIL